MSGRDFVDGVVAGGNSPACHLLKLVGDRSVLTSKEFRMKLHHVVDVSSLHELAGVIKRRFQISLGNSQCLFGYFSHGRRQHCDRLAGRLNKKMTSPFRLDLRFSLPVPELAGALPFEA
jgi:hypothetical protein